MSNLNYTNWWRNGTVDATKNSTEITGASTYWSTTNINPGDIFIDSSGIYEIFSVTDDTHLTLATPYLGNTGSGLAYAIIRNFTSTTNAKVAAMTSELMYEFARFIDNERSTITGKSAYEIAKDNGYVGTEAQWLESLSAYGQAKKNGYTGTMAEWLESLKAAGEWSNANARLTTLENWVNQTWMHNIIPRFRNLGSEITEAQYAAIRNGSYNDLYIGDYLSFPLTLQGQEQNCMAFIIQEGEGQTERRMEDGTINYPFTTNCLHIALSCGLRPPFNDTEEGTGTTYANSTIRNEVLPEILEALESYFGAEHILEWNSRYYSPQVQGGYNGLSKIELFSADEVSYYRTSIQGRTEPYELFRYGKMMYHWPFAPDTWIQETSGNNGYFYHGLTGKIYYREQKKGWGICPHFVIIP